MKLSTGNKLKLSTHQFSKPTQCTLWNDPNAIRGQHKDIFETIDTYVDDEHLIRRLLRCQECGQLYFYEMYEEIDWVDGDDPQYRTYIPVSDMTEVEILNTTATSELLLASPALHSDFPKDAAAPRNYWVGK